MFLLIKMNQRFIDDPEFRSKKSPVSVVIISHFKFTNRTLVFLEMIGNISSCNKSMTKK